MHETSENRFSSSWLLKSKVRDGFKTYPLPKLCPCPRSCKKKISKENNKVDNITLPFLIYSPILKYSQCNRDSNELEPKPRMQPRTGSTCFLQEVAGTTKFCTVLSLGDAIVFI
jgi:hypothetical protein